MIIGTAGHIDHGKTTLVRALTGVDTDRLPEEKRRGISIELGYAYLRAADATSLGFVDVPGHERLLHTMLAGATGVDHALLVVAADDGVMPQTREHLAVVALLGLQRGSVAITKVDRIDTVERAARIAQVRAEIDALLASTPLAGAPVFPVSATTGEGVDALRDHLVAEARTARFYDDALAFRLPVDRAFTLSGVGTVVTGSVMAGSVRIGDELLVMPGERKVRVRGIHAQNEQAESAEAGQRCALALAGIAREDVHRGQWLCAPTIALTTARIDVQLTLWPGEANALRSGTTVHAHLGASDVMASVALLDRNVLAPGDTAPAQLVLRESLSAWHGDRGVLRDASAMRTLAGVRVLDPFAPTRYRRTPERLQARAAWALEDRSARLEALLVGAPLGLDTDRTRRALALRADAALPLPSDAVHLANAAVARQHLAALQQSITDRLTAFHRSAPEEVGPDLRRLKRLAGPRVGDALWQHAVEALLATGALARSGHWLHLPAHAAVLSAAEERLAQKLLPQLADGGFDPPWVRDLAVGSGATEPVVRQTLASLARRGQTWQVVKDLYYPSVTIARLAALARECVAQPEGLQAASFRDATGLGRKRAIQLLEFFDRIGFTRRVKDQHLLRPDTVLFP
ncbi:selenocysteine-specific translation elongation factor [Variovorax sp. PAMC 28711]|uniref:selenocysteine-specific translation elongation factor n=1 Tax=Variovorax sp. PAMC 28711 TaxID=1795631 RepID=UPI00078B9E4D|nr:selenocysteine-specific translation elongation factor [Variovorax sp. PAMC 28711]AMM23730.1 selenocysteine-specific elongation factor [Variovorax sp. PAMC 28711]